MGARKFDRPSSALESALQANTHTHVVRAIVRIFSSGGVVLFQVSKFGTRDKTQ